MTEGHFDDHVGLNTRDFRGIRLVAFHGISGSGKSTAIGQLLQTHPAFRDRARSHILGPRIAWRNLRVSNELVVVDECISIRDLLGLIGLLCRGHRVLAASHLPLFLSTLVGWVWPTLAMRTDRDPAKIARYLEALGASFDIAQVHAFCARFGASYKCIDRILEFDGGFEFNRAYDRFTRCCRVETRRN